MGQLNGYCRARLLLLEIRNYLFTGVPASLRNTQRSVRSGVRFTPVLVCRLTKGL